MKKGDIIRRKLFSNDRVQISVGKYIQITMISKKQVYGRYLGTDEEFVVKPTVLIHCITMHIAYLAIDAKQFDKICKYCTSVQRECCKQWNSFVDKMIEEGVDVICFYNKKRKVYATFELVQKFDAHTNFKLIPTIRIYLRNVIAVENGTV